MSPKALYAMLAALFILVFWMVGAYNRLMALRNGIGQAWSRVDEALKLRAAAAGPLLSVLRGPMSAEEGALDAVQAALAEAGRAAGQMGHKPVAEIHATAWLSAEARLSATATRLFALLEQHSALRHQADVADGARQWQEADTRLAFARQTFNEAAQGYNEALALFPTRLLAPMFRFGRAGHL